MTRLTQLLSDLASDESGQDLIEYALIVCLIAGAALIALTTFGTSISNAFANMAAKFTSVT
jgi:pilus assembly protein Flp/PilA